MLIVGSVISLVIFVLTKNHDLALANLPLYPNRAPSKFGVVLVFPMKLTLKVVNL